MDLTQICKSQIKFQEIESQRKPSLYKSSYGSFEKYNLKEGFFFSNCSKNQILKFNGYILKRIVIDFFGKDPIESNPEVDLIKELMSNDFTLSKIIWAHQCGVGPIDACFSYIKNQSLLIYEFLSKNPGDEFLKEYNKYMNDKEMKLLFLKQLANFFGFLEKYNLIYCDINFKNLFIDEKRTLKIFCIEESLFNNSTNCLKSKEIHKGFVSPEILNKYIKEKIYKEMKFENANYYKSNIYSLGIFACFMLSSLEDESRIGNIDQYKNSEVHHNKIIENIKKIELKIKNVYYSNNLQIILLNCLLYNSEKRISFCELVNVLENIDKLDESKMELFIQNCYCMNSKPFYEISSSLNSELYFLSKKSENLNFSTESNSFIEHFHKNDNIDDLTINNQIEKIFETFNISTLSISILRNELDWDFTNILLTINDYNTFFEVLSLYPMLSSLIICYYDPQKRQLIGKTIEIKKEEASILTNVIKKCKFLKKLKIGFITKDVQWRKSQ